MSATKKEKCSRRKKKKKNLPLLTILITYLSLFKKQMGAFDCKPTTHHLSLPLSCLPASPHLPPSPCLALVVFNSKEVLVRRAKRS